MFFKTKDIPFSPIKAIQEQAEARGAISLAQGIPRFLPPLGVRRAAITAIEEGKADFYGPPRGIPDLRRKISEWHLSRERAFYDPEKEVLVTAGALQGMSAALATLLSPGDELLIPSPSYVPFLNIPRILHVKPVFVPLNPIGWRLRIADLKRAITPLTRGIILCHPNNPTGTVYTREEIEEITALAEKHDFWIFADEVYRFFVDPEVSYTPLGEIQAVRSRLIRLMSFSKAFSLSGWRVGYLLADAPVAKEILKTHEMTLTAGASLPAQYAALSALRDFSHIPEQFSRTLISRRERMRRRLHKLADYFEFNVPEGAYYFFVKPKGASDDAAFAQRLLEEAGVAVVPGSAFGPGGEGYLRFSFAAKEGEIEEAFDRLERYFGSQEKGVGSQEWKELVKGVTGVTDDSRTVGEGNIFVAVSGAKHDGHDFASSALEKGAVLVVGERDLDLPKYLKVENSRTALGQLCAAWYRHPSRKLKMIAVTGTDGKTTTAHLLAAILNRAGISTEVLSTISVPGLHTTTPPAPILQKLLAEAVENGRKAAVVEVTSHGIAQERIAGTQFEAAVLTNVTPEHLDYHETFERYRDTKARLFNSVPLAVLNGDDPFFEVFSQSSKGKVIKYGISGTKNDFSVRDIKSSPSGNRFLLQKGGESIEVTIPLPGEYNVQNALAAAAAASSAAGVSLEDIREALAEFDPEILVGRFERIKEIFDFEVFVDFAHTPAALAKVLNHAALTKKAGSRLLVVFGTAGERDRVKRPAMGAIAARTADLAILTSEDPRSEDPGKIIDEIATGCFAEGAVEGKNFVRVPDRRQAIGFALKSARPGDSILILGKGHETSMAIKGIEHPWSDRKVAKEEFSRMKRRAR